MTMFPDTLRIVRFFKVCGVRAPFGVALLGLALSATGCGKKQQAPVVNAPGTIYGAAPRTVLAEPSARQDVYIEQSIRYDEPPAEYPEALGYDELSNGEQVVVVEYVHTYPEEIETFPEVAWAGRTYYNVHGDFVYWSDGWGWCYYLGPPAPLVTYWNGYYPWAPYAWGVGYYGPGYYWGGVSMYGYHAYGLSVVHASHHHHDYHHNNRRPGRDPKPPQHAGASGPSVPVPGNSTGPGHDGSTTDAPRRANPTGADGSARRTNGASRFASSEPSRRNPTSDGPTRANPSRTPMRTNGYTTAGGQRITVVDPRATRTSPAVRRTNPTTVGTIPAANAPRRSTPAPAFAATGQRQPARTNVQSTTSPRRAQPTRSQPKRSQPSWGSSYSNQPQRTTPTRSAPPRSQPSRSAPRVPPDAAAPPVRRPFDRRPFDRRPFDRRPLAAPPPAPRPSVAPRRAAPQRAPHPPAPLQGVAASSDQPTPSRLRKNPARPC